MPPCLERSNFGVAEEGLDESEWKVSQIPSPNNRTMNSTDTKPTNNLCICAHPLVRQDLSILRSCYSERSVCRSSLRRLVTNIGYEATRDMLTNFDDPLVCQSVELTEKVALIPIIRSEMGMVDPMLNILPDAHVHQMGMYCQNSIAVQYFTSLPKRCLVDVAFILDPVIQDSAIMLSAINILKRWGVKKIKIISLIGYKRNVEEIIDKHPDICITIGAITACNLDQALLQAIGLSSSMSEAIFSHPNHVTKRRKISM